MSKFKEGLKDLLESAVENGIISNKQLGFLQIDEPTVASFFMLPKVYKSAEVSPGRPTV